tara:strand:- start:839 stop:1219 length:381 start_codon:yes stop_codon:yes gene_type:complete
MKTLIALIILYYSSSIFANEFEWERVTANIKGSVFYIDNSTIKRSGNSVVYLKLTDYFKPTTNGRLSSIIYTEVNCDNYYYRYLKDYYYDLPMGKGEPSNIIEEKSEWFYAPKGSTAFYINEKVCN